MHIPRIWKKMHRRSNPEAWTSPGWLAVVGMALEKEAEHGCFSSAEACEPLGGARRAIASNECGLDFEGFCLVLRELFYKVRCANFH